MVNEINKPTTTTRENEALRVRMENANRNVQTMQQEHNELLREMETLRQRAAELSLRRSQENSSSSSNNEATPQNDECENKNSEDLTPTNDAEELHVEERTSSSNTNTNNEPTAAVEKVVTEEEEDPENAEYIREKIEEIAALKAQFKRVQHMVNTSNLIEEHLSRGVPPSQEAELMSHPPSTSSNEAAANTEAGVTTENDLDAALLNYGQLTSNITNDDTQEKEELLRAMLSMFNDFTTDLRDQATTLRAERDRLRALRDEILSRRRQQ